MNLLLASIITPGKVYCLIMASFVVGVIIGIMIFHYIDNKYFRW